MKWMACLALAFVQDADVVRRILPKAEGVQKKEFNFQSEDLKKLARAIGADPRPEGAFYTATVELSYPERGNYATRTTVVTTEGGSKLVVTILPEQHLIFAVKPMDDKTEAEGFLEQFQFMSYSTDALWRPRQDLADRLARAQDPKSEDDRTLASLLAVRSAMRGISESMPKLKKALAANDHDAASAAVSELERAAAKYQEPAFLGEKTKKFGELWEDVSARFKQLHEAVGKDDAKAQAVYADTSRKACVSCHREYQETIQAKREAVGLGDGYFSIGFDLKRDANVEPKVQDSIASAVRRAVLYLELGR